MEEICKYFDGLFCEIIKTVTIVILLLIAVCYIGSLVLAKDTKEFHIHFDLIYQVLSLNTIVMKNNNSKFGV